MNRRTAPDGTDDFDVTLVQGFSSYVSSIDPTIADSRVLVKGSMNVYKKVSGTVAVREGRKLYDASVDSTNAKVNSGFVWNNTHGTTFPLRCADGKLQFESDITGARTWYTLLSSLTKTRFVFDTYWDNTDKKDKLLCANGTAGTVYDWAGGVAQFVSAINNTSITLDRDPATAGFASTGTVVIGNNTYTYTGRDSATNKLTGVTGDASAETVGSAVYSQIITTTSFTSGPATTFACDFVKVIANQLYLGSYTSQLVYVSKNSSYTDFSFSSPRLSGEGDVLLLDAPCKGIGQIQGNAAVFYGTSHVAQVVFNQVTVGTVLSEQTKLEKVYLGNNCAALGHEFIDQLQGNILYLGQDNQLHAYGLFTNTFAAKPVLLSQAVQEELANEDFTLGQLRVQSDKRGDIVYITSPVSGKTYVYQERTTLNNLGQIETERIWQPPMTWNITRIDAIGGQTIGFSNESPQIYYLWDTGQWYDDSPVGALPNKAVMLLSYSNNGRRQGKLNFDKVYWEGYITTNTPLYGGIYYDYQGSTGILNPIINDQTSLLTSGQLFSGSVPPSLGDSSLGDNPLGDGIVTDSQSLIPKFRAMTSVQQVDCFEYALMAYSNSVGARWEMLAVGTTSTLSFAEAVEIMK